MIHQEPDITVALMQRTLAADLHLEGVYRLSDGRALTGAHNACAGEGFVVLKDASGQILTRQRVVSLVPDDPAQTCFTLQNVRIGIRFHWQREQAQTFRGGIVLASENDGSFSVQNVIGLEDYLASVISSEMSAEAPLEFLKTQAITARSWLVAMLEKKKAPRTAQFRSDNEIRVWQDVNDHEGFDVCADDHCQRYQGITKIISGNVALAIETTRGVFLTHADAICDARYYKCCGGQTDVFSTAWEDASPPYLACITDYDKPHAAVVSEEDAARWFASSPAAYCNTDDPDILRRILPAFDYETLNFYRWRVACDKETLENILREKSGIDFGELQHIIPLQRGPSGRIRRLKIIGTKKTMIVGKELEIRRWLSQTHLLSSAFVVTSEHDTDGAIKRFIFHGGGWGHGVGLCQIGAAVMAVRGFRAENILSHYFPGAHLRKLY
ncbi:MAG: SpoIID/LytB domain-containing protein [Smithellaceae bacterium]